MAPNGGIDDDVRLVIGVQDGNLAHVLEIADLRIRSKGGCAQQHIAATETGLASSVLLRLFVCARQLQPISLIDERNGQQQTPSTMKLRMRYPLSTARRRRRTLDDSASGDHARFSARQRAQKPYNHQGVRLRRLAARQGISHLSFIVLGVLLLTISFVYQRDWLQLSGAHKKSQEHA